MLRIVWFLLYIVAEILTLYLLLLAIAWLVITYGQMPNKEMVLVMIQIVLIPGAIVGATVGTGRANGGGFYRPVRPLAFMAQFLGIILDGSSLPLVGNRQPIDIPYGGSDIASYDVITALSGHLRQRGIRHTASGGISVDDNGTSWWLEAELGEPRLTGWVQSEDPRDRELVVRAIHKFLRDELKLKLA